ncbi:MAG: GDP-mannose 4,6-dehydratase, partial [Bacteroidota bacterium]
MKKLVLITGASGFVGTHCIVQLIQKGYAVRGTLRSLSRADSIRQIIRENTEGDFDLTFV